MLDRDAGQDAGWEAGKEGGQGYRVWMLERVLRTLIMVLGVLGKILNRVGSE